MRPCTDGKIILKWNLIKHEDSQEGLHSSHSGWGSPGGLL